MKTEPLTDVELVALAAIANVEAVIMAGDNEQRKMQGYTAAWQSGCGLMTAGMRLYDELQKRNILP